MHKFVPYVLQPPRNCQHGVVSIQSPVEGLSILQRTYGTQAGDQGDVETMVSPDSILSMDTEAIISHDRVALYQDYDGSNTEV